MKPRQLIEVTCIDCGCSFMAGSKAAKRCPECNLKHRKNQKQGYAEDFKSTRKVRKKKQKPKSITQVLRELEVYNKEHKTHLSYGKFVELMAGGKLDT